ncbi:MAG TPA: PVC-type heme-binding CxxCH protein, partial [Pirellulaceae bacterium]|nr:PVC-type heme-binding CxxCH protein [Pirellulaceae bacterium]
MYRLFRCFCLALFFALPAASGQEFKPNPLNEPEGNPGVIPVGEDGKPLNLNFETGTLHGWKAEGKAFKKQPVKGEISANRPFGEGKKAEMTGQFWIGGYEFLQDGPQGTLTSPTFEVTQPFGSFLIGGGAHRETRVELVLADNNRPFYSVSGRNEENLRPVIVDLSKQVGKRIYIRIVDQHSGGWGHVNFDDFRLHAQRPKFRSTVVATPSAEELYPHAGIAAEEAAKAMIVPEGFKVQVAAAEPDVQQPIAMAIDDRGRIWIAEAHTYPVRAPEGEGKDRILIFEDTDLDGTLDKRTVFIEGLNLVSGLELGFGGVYVGAAPYLLFIPDKDGDDKPDGEPQVLLDGWGYEDTHETLNSFIWGPDGWLYGCHGVFTHSNVGKPGTPKEKRTKINAGIWRYHPVRHEFEVFAEGTSNPWGLDYDQYGNFFATACVIPHCYHIIPGARYERQAGNHFNPYTYDDIKTIADHRHYTGNQWNDDNRRQSDELGGGHAHAGCMIYQGGAWPEKYRGQLFMNNIHGNRMNMDILTPKGSGFVCSHGPDFLFTRDQWSQMLTMTYGPDGQVWVIDWYDRQQCHLKEPSAHDRSNGRIYRIVYGDAKPVKVDLGKMSDEELVKLLWHDNRWYQRHAQRILQERTGGQEDAHKRISASLNTNLAILKELERRGETLDTDLPAIWGMRAISIVRPKSESSELKDDSFIAMVNHLSARAKDLPNHRAQCIHLLTELIRDAFNVPDQRSISAIAELSKNEPSPITRLAIASMLQSLELSDRWSILEALTSHAEDAADHNLPLMYWYAMEPLADVDPKRALALGLSAGERIPILKEFMIRRIGAGDPEKSLALLVAGLKEAKDDATRLTFLRGMNEALKGRRDVKAPAEWKEISTSLVESKNADLRMQAVALAVTFGDQKVLDTLRQMVRDENSPLTERRAAIAILTKAKDPLTLPPLVELLADPRLRGDSIRAMASFDDPQIPSFLIEGYASFAPSEQRDALVAMCSRPGFAKVLLEAIDKKQIPANHLTADLVTQLRNLGDEALNKRIEQVWGIVRESPADRAKLIAEFKSFLMSPSAVEPDLELGRAMFAKTCQKCHILFGAGNKIGPDITGSQRANLEYLLSNIIDPSAVMAKEYAPHVVRTADGQVITGILKGELNGVYTFQTPDNVLELSKDDIEEMNLSEKSLMPDNQIQQFTQHELRSLVAYLSAGGQTPMLATKDNVAGFFNGKDLTGWRGDEKLWSVENGEIVGNTEGLAHNTWLVNELSVGDFRLELDVKLVDNAGNSGIQIRSQPMADGEVKGYQADIGAGWWGKLYEEHGRALLWDKSGEEHVKKGDWNRYEIVCVGSRTQTWINGHKCVDLDDPQGARRGIIALQLHSGGKTEVRFKNLKLTLLPGIEKSSPYPTSLPLEEGQKITFKKTVLEDLNGSFRSEGVGYGDFNNDGRLDIAAGSVWFEAPPPSPQPLAPSPWKRHNILAEPKQFLKTVYSDTFMNWAEDVDGDGRQDLIVVDFPGKPTWWFKNPGPEGGEWARNMIVKVTNNESPQYLDVDKDGKRELVFGDGTERLCLARPSENPLVEWRTQRISQPGEVKIQAFYHGLGIGDINVDGRDDLLVPHGWWEAPAGEHAGHSEPWPFHQAPFGEAQAQMYVYDFDGDGDNDVLGSSAHRRGIWWYEQLPENQWKTHEIDDSIAQTHALILTDINGDGLPDFVTGKRYYAHNGRDPGEDEPALIAWYELSRTDGKPEWTQHIIDRDSG